MKEQTKKASANNPAINWAVAKRIIGYVLHYRWQMIVVVLAIVVSAIAQAASAMFLQSLVDAYILPLIGQSSPNWAPLLRMIAMMAGIYAIGVLSSWLWSRLIVDIDQGVMRTIRDDMFTHQQSLRVRYFDQHGYGDVMSRYTNDTDVLRSAIAWAFPDVFSCTMSCVCAFVAMMLLSLPIAGMVLAFTVVLIFCIYLLMRRSGVLFARQQVALGDLNACVEESVNGTKVIKVFRHEEASIAQFDERADKVNAISASANSYANSVIPLVVNASYFLYVLIALFGAWATSVGWHNVSMMGSGALTLGTLLSLLALSRAFINPISEIAMQANVMMMALAGAARIFSLLDEPQEEDNGSVQLVKVKLTSPLRQRDEVDTQVAAYQSTLTADMAEDAQAIVDNQRVFWAWKREMNDAGRRAIERASSLRSTAQALVLQSKREAITSSDGCYSLVRGDVRFTDVSFSYEQGTPVLHDITWFAKPGQKIALVGSTGAGKTTIANLLTRFYDIDDGQILYDGIDVRDIKKGDLRHAIGTVLQEINLFSGTIMDNIRYGRLDASDEACVNAAKLAHAHEFITQLPNGYDTMLTNNGEGLSQGQKQLISIARAAVVDPPVLILDEATSSIDTRTEQLVQQGMDALMQGRTVFVIAHRLSTIRNADVIMVLDHGRIIERGTHAELLAKRGEYYQLYTGIMELE